jgi:hypothetical protein
LKAKDVNYMGKQLSKRAIASRNNGAKSHGPKTEEGKKRSSMNALRHGLLALNVVLPSENLENFGIMHDYYIEKFDPADGVEHDRVEEMVAASWRLRRCWAYEAILIELEARKRTESNAMVRQALAFRELAKEPALQLLRRYEGDARRTFAHAQKHLLEVLEEREYETNLDSDNPSEINDVEAASLAPEPPPPQPQSPILEPSKSPQQDTPKTPPTPSPTQAKPVDLNHGTFVKTEKWETWNEYLGKP